MRRIRAFMTLLKTYYAKYSSHYRLLIWKPSGNVNCKIFAFIDVSIHFAVQWMGIKMTATTTVHIIVPLIMFATIVILGFWTRFYVIKLFERHQQNAKWVHASLVVKSLFNPIIIWFIILGSYAAILISILSPTIKKLSGEALASLFVISFTWVIIGLSEKFIRFNQQYFWF